MVKKGRKHSEETKQKISISRRKYLKNHPHNHLGNKLSEETKRKIGLANSIALKGRKVPFKVRIKMGKARMGHLTSKETRRKIGLANSKSLKGKKLSLQHKKNIGKSIRGEKNPQWRGGITPLIRQIRNCFEYRQWRSDVFTRDDFTCQKCFARGYKINAHHVKRFSIIMKENKIKTFHQALLCEELWNINNGRTLCDDCHKH